MSETRKLCLLESCMPFEYEAAEVEVPPLVTEDVHTGRTVELPATKKIILKGILQKADTLNQNGRIYGEAILSRELMNYQKFVIENRALGECDHPESSVVSLKNASHLIRKAEMRSKEVYGELEILHRVPSGAILRGLIEHGVKLGISSRGVGSTKKQGDYHVVQDDFQLICFDIVSEPSTSGAFMIPEGKLIESKELMRFLTKSDRIDRVLNEILLGGK